MKKKSNLLFIFSMILFLCGIFLIVYSFCFANEEVVYKEESINEGIKKVYDSVVVIENYQDGKLDSTGSGFVYSKDGYVMSNYHVIEDASELVVILSNGEKVTPTVIGSDIYSDIAVLKIDNILGVATIGNSSNVELGDSVFTVGSPISAKYSGTVTRGIISGKNRMVEVSVSSSTNDWILNVMQTDASINPGNSGGPLCDIDGNVIGITNMKIIEDEVEGIGFAIPIEDAITYANDIVNGKERKLPYLGINMSNINTNGVLYKMYADSSVTKGVMVAKVSNDSPASEASLHEGDIITKINNIDVKNVAEFRYYLYKNEPGDKIEITFMRKDKEIKANIVLGES